MTVSFSLSTHQKCMTIAKKCKSFASYQKYRAAKNKVVTLLRQNKAKFFRRLGTASKKDFWKLMNKQESSIPTLNDNSVKVESSHDKAVLLNIYFYKCFNTSVSPLHQPQLNLTIFPVQLLCTEEIFLTCMVAELDCNKSTGPDDISTRMLKGTATSVTLSLTRLFNLS